MRKGYGGCSVCVSVCYRASYYIPRLYIENKMPLGFLWRFQDVIVWISWTAMASFQED